MNTPLVAFVVILGITWAEALPKRIDIVIGSRNTQSNNTFEMGHVPNNKTTNSSQITYGSVTNQHDERFFILGRANKTEVLTPQWYDKYSEIPRSVIVSTDPDLPADRINSNRRQKVQENLNSLTGSCQELKGKLYQALQGGQNKQTIINLIQDSIKIELDLQNQQKSLDQFNYVMPLTQSKHDDFDNNLRTILLKIENLILRSLLIIRPKN
ncbi:hypothetical protein CcBV_30.1 [Bracoviriform congregatae]|uniref:Uncharacterized protein n=1 Tax=Bracoviriform congregatae TaxID=39640 RepID=Q5ZNV8_9VIRU|nr:hypothetical protein CcBV_30.1 [Bracoviriform congregatae]CAG17498.1 hypothetical protein CcBV_30.1 [Bracoviriform congregatae]